MLTLQDIGEDELIRRLTQQLPQGSSVLMGVGDDCAVIQPPAGNLLLKVDAVVEGVHFLRSAVPQEVGRKALARAVSDIAAMGGLPKHALVTLVLPQDLEVRFVEQLYEGMTSLAQEFGVEIVGGETTRGAVIMISIALTGEATRWVSRSGGKAGDLLLVTGRLGGSIQGRHFSFHPRVREAQWLMQHYPPHAMMDISDGLAKDLPRLAKASGLEFIISESSLPCTLGCTPAQAWGDGEDYELLLATDADQAKSLVQQWPFADVPLTCIGKLVPAGEGKVPNFTSTGWDHFAKDA